MTIAPRRDVLILHPLGRVEDQPGALHVAIGQRRRPSTTLKLATIIIAELDPVTAGARHDT